MTRRVDRLKRAGKSRVFASADYLDIPCKRVDKMRWYNECQRRGMSLSEFVTESCNLNLPKE